MTWKHIRNGRLTRRVLKGGKIIATPLIPAAVELLERLKAEGVPHGPDDPVMLVHSPVRALTNACKRLGRDHIRVHDLRHIFATRCVEGGVDFKTLGSWLGHKDGGQLAAKTYAHLVESHSESQARKVKA